MAISRKHRNGLKHWSAFPETLVSCIAATMVTISIYLNMENPTIHGLEHYHNEMVMGFATLVENKDDNT